MKRAIRAARAALGSGVVSEEDSAGLMRVVEVDMVSVDSSMGFGGLVMSAMLFYVDVGEVVLRCRKVRKWLMCQDLAPRPK